MINSKGTIIAKDPTDTIEWPEKVVKSSHKEEEEETGG